MSNKIEKTILDPKETTVLLCHPTLLGNKHQKKIKKFAHMCRKAGCGVVYVEYYPYDMSDITWLTLVKDGVHNRREPTINLLLMGFEEYNKKELIDNYLLLDEILVVIDEIKLKGWSMGRIRLKNKTKKLDPDTDGLIEKFKKRNGKWKDIWKAKGKFKDWVIKILEGEILRESREAIGLLKDEKILKKNVLLVGGYLGRGGCVPAYATVLETYGDITTYFLIDHCYAGLEAEKVIKERSCLDGLTQKEIRIAMMSGKKMPKKATRIMAFRRAVAIFESYVGTRALKTKVNPLLSGNLEFKEEE